MIYLAGNISGSAGRAAFENANIGQLLSPLGWRRPQAELYACDNDVFAHRDDPAWWQREGEKRWLKMLDKMATLPPPLWCILPDVVGNWNETIERAHVYRGEVESRGLRIALALQDGCNWKEANDFAPFCVFVGGSTAWKWANVPRTIQIFQNRAWVHVGRVNGEKRIRFVRKLGADSADGTGLCRFFDEQLPRVLRGLNCESLQMEMF